MNTLAQKIIFPGTSGTPIEGPLPTLNGGGTEFNTLGDFVSKLLPLVFVAGGLILFVMLVAAGFQYLTSAGEAKAAESAQKKITSALLGFVILFIAFWLTQLLSGLFGFKMFGS